ncbi:MAG: M43 family zinc metalloprotease, partial [Bacteroidota bacterium]
MKVTYVVCAVLTVMCSCINAFAQQQVEYRECDTEIMWQKALQKNPELAEKAKMSLEFFREYAGPDQKVETSSVPVLYIIPTVFHVIHDYGIEDISKAQILDAIDILNKSFQKLNDDTNDVIPLFQPIFADCQIEFRLATLDPSGNCTDGINRIQSDDTYNAGDNVKGLIDWPSNKYLNIWVVSNIGSGAAGYSYYPGISSGDDGIVIRHDYVGGIGTSNGSNYTERSLTHEVGHWLNLPHTWGSTNTPGDPANCGTDDGVFDTPNTAGTNNFSCNVNQNTCGQIDNVQNYMDYAGCHKMFTNGQKARMHAALNSGIGQRNNLSTPSNLAATGTEDGTLETICNPVADFSDRNLAICSGTQVHFKDLSWGDDITSWQWTCPGGTPASSTSANPVIQYDVPGIYDVTLNVGTATGNSQLTRTAFVQVLEDTGLITVPYTEGFETISLSGSGWTTENPDNNNTWAITSVAGASGNKSLQLINQTGNSSGSRDA